MANLDSRAGDPKFEASQTKKNLEAAFAGESQARNKYTYFASKAKKDGYVQIASIFEETAGNEKEHAKMWAKILGLIGDTEANLEAAAGGENYEWTEMYPGFAKEHGYGWESSPRRRCISAWQNNPPWNGRPPHRKTSCMFQDSLDPYLQKPAVLHKALYLLFSRPQLLLP